MLHFGQLHTRIHTAPGIRGPAHHIHGELVHRPGVRGVGSLLRHVDLRVLRLGRREGKGPPDQN